MKIAILNFRNISSPSHGGAEVYLETLAREWIKLGHDVTFFSPKPRKPITKNLNSNIRYIECGNFLTSYNRIPKAVLSMKWDLVIDCINVRGFHIDSWIIKFTEQPKYLALIFQTAEEVWDEMLPFPLSTIGRRILEPYWLSKYKKSKILTICNSSAESLIKYGLKNVRVLNPGFEFDPDFESPEQFNISPNDQIVEIVFCARLVGMKRPKDAIDALGSISAMDKSRKYRLHIIGDGKLRKKLEDYAKKLNLPIIFHGRISNYERNSIYAKSHFLLATSVREGWGLTVSEAAYYGCIPIVYDVPGLRDSAHLVGGFVVEEDSHKLAYKMKEIVGSEKRISNSIRRIQTWEETAKQFLTVAE